MNRRTGNIIVAVTICQLAVMSQLTAQDSVNVSLVGSLFNFWGQCYTVAVNGNYAYVSADESGLHIMDISQPELPVEVGFYDADGLVYDIKISENLMFLAVILGDPGYPGALEIVDISDHMHPSKIGHCDIPNGYAISVDVSGDFAYLGCSSNFVMVNISDPHNPYVWYQIWGAASDVKVSGDYVYLAYGTLKIISVVDPNNPFVLVTYNTPGSAGAVEVVGNIAYVADGDAGLRLIDVSDPQNPNEIGCYDSLDLAQDVAVVSNLAYVVDNDSSLHIIDVSNHQNPTEIGCYHFHGRAHKAVVSGSHVFLALTSISSEPNENSGLRIVDVSTPANPSEIGHYYSMGMIYDVSMSERIACLACGEHGIMTLDVANPHNPIELAQYDTTGEITSVTVSGSYLYAFQYPPHLRIIVWSIANPEQPLPVGSCQAFEYLTDMVVSDNYLYAASFYYGIQIFDISNPYNPNLIYCPEDYLVHAYGIDVENNYAYLGGAFSLFYIIDITNPSNPSVVSNITMPAWVYGVDVVGDIAYIADGSCGLQIYNVSDPYNPFLLGSYDTPGWARKVNVVGPHAYIADDTRGIYIVNIEDPQNPFLVGYYNTPAAAYNIAVSNEYAYVADLYRFEILDCSQAQPVSYSNDAKLPTEFSLSPAYPNPFNNTTILKYSIPQTGRVTLTIYNILGESVTTIVDHSMMPGVYSTVWNAEKSASGIYFCRMESESFQQTRKLVLIK